MKRLILSSVYVLALAGCATSVPPTHVSSQKYTCADGTQLDVKYEANTATVTLENGQVVTMPQLRTGSGFAYSSGQYELRGKGADFTWAHGRKAAVACHVL